MTRLDIVDNLGQLPVNSAKREADVTVADRHTKNIHDHTEDQKNCHYK